jgi:excisionase family DNA binding protein
MDKELLTIDELADELKVNKSWIYARTREKGPDALPRIRLGRYLRFEKNEVIDWLRAKTTEEG